MEDELATTQKFAGIPVRLPYDQENTTGSGSGRRDGQLSPPELLKQPPVSIVIMPISITYHSAALKLEKSAISKVQKPIFCHFKNGKQLIFAPEKSVKLHFW